MSAAAVAADPLQAIRQQAAEWVAALAEQPLDAELLRAHADWCARDARHQSIYADIARLWNAATPEALELPGEAALARQAEGKSSRLRNAVLGLALVVVAGWAALQTAPGAELLAGYLADQRTGAGEVRSFTLADGSRITLNTRSAVDIDYSPQRRVLRLRRGEVLVQVAKDGRPFEVQGRDGAVRAMGTRYAVRQDATDSRVSVTESTVQITPAQAPGQATPLSAGQSARFDAHRVLPLPDDAGPAALSWAQGILVFNDAPLPQVLAELARYRAGVLDVDAPALQNLRFTGVLPVAQPREALALLVNALPIQVTFYTDYLALVRRQK
ncbi:FecR family protein [Rhodoferax sp.]|uniref:FecR family protein n=1 Tax=Rhodoferax sp. TaxID=50421 RepID=UPI00374D858A